MEMKKIKVLIVDDHKVVRDGIKFMIQMQGQYEADIHEAENGNTAIDRVKVFDYDLIIMDINMPGKDGIATTKEIRNIDKNASILALTMHEEEIYIIKMLRAGAMGYILKNTGTEELNAAIKTILNGEKYYSNAVAVKLIEPYHHEIIESKPGTRQTASNIFTKREMEVLRMIASGYTNFEIAERLNLSKRTVDSHRQNMLNKVQVNNTAGLMKYATQNDLL
jgi:DNA-binding NarL/FixJ family response regulator